MRDAARSVLLLLRIRGSKFADEPKKEVRGKTSKKICVIAGLKNSGNKKVHLPKGESGKRKGKESKPRLTLTSDNRDGGKKGWGKVFKKGVGGGGG